MRAAHVLGVAAVGVVAIVAAFALALTPGESNAWVPFLGLLAAAAMIQSVVSEPNDLTAALLLALPLAGVVGSQPSTAWLVAPLGALLLLAGELNAVAWDTRGRDPGPGVARSRLGEIGILTGIGLVVAVLVGGAALLPFPTGALGVLLGSAGVAGVGWVVFGSGSRNDRRGGGRSYRAHEGVPRAPLDPNPGHGDRVGRGTRAL